MGLTIEKLSVPLQEDAEGVVRVGGTRVTLGLADVYAVIASFLQNRPAVGAHLREQEREGAEIQRQVEARCDPTEFRQRLLARRKETA